MSTVPATLVSVIAPARLLVSATFIAVITPIAVVSMARLILASRALVPTLILWWGVRGRVCALRLVA